MPTYDFICKDCNQRFDIFLTFSEYGKKTVTCTHCKAWIPLVAWEERLCAECGAERIDEPGPCQFCEHEGEITPALDSGPVKWQCPYCRRGYLTFSPAG